MKSYNFLKLGADMLGGMVAADEMEKKDKLMEWQRQERESGIAANNALVRLRDRQVTEIDAKAAEEEAMRAAFGGMDIYSPEAIPTALKYGNLNAANIITKFQVQRTKEELYSLAGTMKHIMTMPADKRSAAFDAALETQVKLNPQQWTPIRDKMRGQYSDDFAGQIIRNMEAIAAATPKDVEWRMGPDGRHYPIYGGTMGEGQGPAKPPMTEKEMADKAREDRKDAEKRKADKEAKAQRERELRVDKDLYDKMTEQQKKQARLSGDTTFAQREKNAALWQAEFGKQAAPPPAPPPASAPSKATGGKVHKFANMAEAQAALKAGKIKKGDRFDIGGRTGVVQ